MDERDPLLDLLNLRGWPHGQRVALSVSEGGGFSTLTYRELEHRARRLSDWILERGFPRGERVAILSEARPEWSIALFAAVRSGATVVPLDPKLTRAELEAILADAAPRLVFVSSRLSREAAALESLTHAIAAAGAAAPGIVLLDGASAGGRIPAIDDLAPVRPRECGERTAGETALIVYTSGTTGRPKGVMITFRSLVFEVRALYEVAPIQRDDVFLSILPLSHLLELTGGLLSVLHAGAEVCYGQTLIPGEIARIIQARTVTRMVAVPLFLTLLAGEVRKAFARAGWATRLRLGAAGMIFRIVAADGIARPPASRTVRRRLAGPIHSKLGGSLQSFIVGGAPLDPRIEDLFQRIGIDVHQGYGLTECSPVIAVNTSRAHRRGSVGRPLPGVEVRIARRENDAPGAVGEILTRGPHVMKGYYGRDDLTREAIDADGWFHTGDLGRIDGDGFLYVTGRLKDLIVRGDGRKVHPEEVEAALGGSGELEEACVVGSRALDGLLAGTEEVCAVVVPSGALRARCSGREDRLAGAVRQEVERLASALAPHKRPSRIVLHPGPLPRSASHKLKRGLVLEWLEANAGMPR